MKHFNEGHHGSLKDFLEEIFKDFTFFDFTPENHETSLLNKLQELFSRHSPYWHVDQKREKGIVIKLKSFKEWEENRFAIELHPRAIKIVYFESLRDKTFFDVRFTEEIDIVHAWLDQRHLYLQFLIAISSGLTYANRKEKEMSFSQARV